MSHEIESVIDATDLILGRLASVTAKRLLQGERINIINAEKAVVSGNRKGKVTDAKKFLTIGHPGQGPYHHREPERMIKRTVRGMLPRGKSKGREALKNLRVYSDLPDLLKDAEKLTLPEARADKLKCPYITLGDLAKEIGWVPRSE